MTGRRARLLRLAPWALLVLCLAWNAMVMVQVQAGLGKAWLFGWDDNFYLAWGRSLVVDGDWDFTNDVVFVASLTTFGETAAKFQAHLTDEELTPAGRVANKYACGVGLLALPALLSSRLVLDGLAAIGLTRTPDPFSSLYAFAFVATGIAWGFAGFWACRILLGRVYSTGVSWWALLAGAAGLPLGYYVWFEPTMAHATGFGVASLYVLAVSTWGDRAAASADRAAAAWAPWALVMGLGLGLACLVRYTNVVLVLVPVVVGWTLWSRLSPRAWLRVVGCSLGLAALGTALGFLPQLIAWKVVYGAFFVDAYWDETLSAWPSQFLAVLLGPRNGLLSWTPLAAVGIVGLVLGFRRGPMHGAGLLVLCATAWIYAGWEMYWLGHSFGMRGFVDVSFFLILGIGEVFDRLQRVAGSTAARLASRVAVALLVAWTLHLIVCYRAAIQPHGEPLALRPILTEWDRWASQIYADTGLRQLTKRALGRPW